MAGMAGMPRCQHRASRSARSEHTMRSSRGWVRSLSAPAAHHRAGRVRRAREAPASSGLCLRHSGLCALQLCMQTITEFHMQLNWDP